MLRFIAFKVNFIVEPTTVIQVLHLISQDEGPLVFGLDLKYLNFDLFQHPYFHSAATSGRPSVNFIAHTEPVPPL